MPNVPDFRDLSRQQRAATDRFSIKNVIGQISGQSVVPPAGPSPTPTPSITPTITPTVTVTPTNTCTPTITPTITPTSSVTPTVTPTNTVTPTITPTQTPPPTLQLQAMDEVAIIYNQNSSDSVAVANYYKNNRPNFNLVRTVGLDIPQAIYPARIDGSGNYFCVSGCDIDSPYEGCRKYDHISITLAQTQIASVLSAYKVQYPTTKYFVFMIDVPIITVPDAVFNVPTLSASQIPLLGQNVTGMVYASAGIWPFYITAALSADCIAYIDKIKNATQSGLTLYKDRGTIYSEDSYGAGYDNLLWAKYPQTMSQLSAFSVYRSGKPTANAQTTGLTGIFMDQNTYWPHNTGNITVSSVAAWSSWGFNGRRYSPYSNSDSLSAWNWYNDPRSPGKLTFTGNDTGWYFTLTLESWNGQPHGGSYGYFGGYSGVGNTSWGSFPAAYAGIKDFNAFKLSSQFNQGLRPIRHSSYTQYFAKSAFGGSNYEYTPVAWAGNTAEPFYPGSLNIEYLNYWMSGATAYESIKNNINNTFRILVIGDPLVRLQGVVPALAPR